MLYFCTRKVSLCVFILGSFPYFSATALKGIHFCRKFFLSLCISRGLEAQKPLLLCHFQKLWTAQFKGFLNHFYITNSRSLAKKLSLFPAQYSMSDCSMLIWHVWIANRWGLKNINALSRVALDPLNLYVWSSHIPLTHTYTIFKMNLLPRNEQKDQLTLCMVCIYHHPLLDTLIHIWN